MRSALHGILIVSLAATSLYADDSLRITRDIVYGRKAGMALTYDVIQHKEKDNDAAVVFMVSGGWFSRWRNPERYVQARSSHFRDLVDDGYTLYLVCHGSAPLFKVPDAVADVRRAIRHIRAHAEDFTIDPERIGVFGGSAGGHLSLMLGTTSDPGNAEGPTDVDKASSRVAAVVAYFPPVDLRRMVGPSRSFPALDFAAEKAADVSPVLHVSPDDPPTLLIHGDEDELVPLANSERMLAALQQHQVTGKLIVLPGAAHGFRGDDSKRASTALKAWFDQHLAKTKKPAKQPKNYPPVLPGAKREVYRHTGEAELRIWRFEPPGHKASDRRAAVVFFFGGGWKSGTPGQFEQQCRYLASRGMVAMTADYRVRTRHNTLAFACVEDGKAAIRWVRENAARLGIDPDRIVAGGGSAGGHVAACTGTVTGFESGNPKISSRPNAMALFNPAVVLDEVPGYRLLSDEKRAELAERMGVPSARLSPFHQLRPGIPPTIIFHGEEDTTVPYATAELFTKKAKELGDDVTLAGYAGQTHGFFNYGRGDNAMFLATMKRLDKFLVLRGCLQGKENVEAWLAGQQSGP